MSDRGVFVCGSPFAETNTVAWALAQHERFWASSESRFLFNLFGRSDGLAVPYLFHHYQLAAADGAWLAANAVSYPELAEAIGSGIDRLFQSRSGDRRWIDCSPENALIIDTLLLMFPTAAFVGIAQSVESARCMASVLAQPSDPKEIDSIAEHYHRVLSQAALQYPDRVFLVNQDELIDDPDRLFMETLEFLGEENDPSVARFFCNRLFKMDCGIEEARRRMENSHNDRESDKLRAPHAVRRRRA